MEMTGSVVICRVGADKRAAERMHRLARGMGRPFGLVLDLTAAGADDSEDLQEVLVVALGQLATWGLRAIAIIAHGNAVSGATEMIRQAGAGEFVRVCDSMAGALAYLDSHGLRAVPGTESDA